MESRFLPALMNRGDGFLPGEPPRPRVMGRRVMVTVPELPWRPEPKGEPGKAMRTKPKTAKKKEA